MKYLKKLPALFEFNLNPEVCGKYTSSSKVQTERFVFSTASQQNTEGRASNGLRTVIFFLVLCKIVRPFLYFEEPIDPA